MEIIHLTYKISLKWDLICKNWGSCISCTRWSRTEPETQTLLGSFLAEDYLGVGQILHPESSQPAPARPSHRQGPGASALLQEGFESGMVTVTCSGQHPERCFGECLRVTREDVPFPSLRTKRGCFPSFQPQCHRDALGGFATLLPFSFLRHPLRSSGQQHTHNPRAEVQLPPSLGSGSAPALLVRGKRLPYTARQSLRSPNRRWLLGRVAPAAAVTWPCTEPEGQQERGQQLHAAGSKAEGCEYTSPSSSSVCLHHGVSSE